MRYSSLFYSSTNGIEDGRYKFKINKHQDYKICIFPKLFQLKSFGIIFRNRYRLYLKREYPQEHKNTTQCANAGWIFITNIFTVPNNNY